MDLLRNAFCDALHKAVEVENGGQAISGEYFFGSIRDQMLCEHIDLVAKDPQYSDLYKAFKETTAEMNAFVLGASECNSYELIEQYWKEQEALGVTSDGLNTKYTQQEDLLYAMYRALTP